MNSPFYLTIHHLVANAALGYCRIAPVFYLLPFLNGGNVPGVVRTPVIAMVALAITPYHQTDFTRVVISDILLVVFRETTTGLLLGCLLACPVWIFGAIGSFIDNQRGATLSSTLDPSTGVDSSELSKFFSLVACVIYLSCGGMVKLLEVLHRSYVLSDPYSGTLPDLTQMLGFLNYLVGQSLVLSAPVIVVMLGAEVLLGILSRFAAQLNAFSVSLTIKSALAFFILLLFFYPVLTEKVLALSFMAEELTRYFRG